jgi:hypothetical protein
VRRRSHWAPVPGRYLSSLAPEHVVNLVILVPDQATERSTFTDRTPLLEPSLMHQVPSICFTLSLIFNPQIIFFPMLRWVDDVFDTH